MQTATAVSQCAHCGEPCAKGEQFCCHGCKMVYELLNEHGLCDYYTLNARPGTAQRVPVRQHKFAFLDEAPIHRQLIQYEDEQQAHVTFYIPNIHCSSCLWLLENLHKVNPGVQQVNVNFSKKEARVIFMPQQTTLRKVVETLASIGYEPYISLQDLQQKKPPVNRRILYQLGVAGFCFANIMLLSFPEYFSGENHMDGTMGLVFRYLNLALSLPVFFFSAQPFYASAWKGLKHGFLNIDVPIVLAIVVTFVRSVTDVLMGSGAGYFDSMTGIVLFMLTGRILQDKTYKGLSFDRDYTAYFPIAVTVIKGQQEVPVQLPDVKTGDTLLIHHQELVPADGILVKGKALIDYSFVTGESAPVTRQMGEIIYAGGRQLEGNMEILTIKEVAQSYLTSLWNRDEMQHKQQQASFIHLLGRNFTWIVLFIAAVTTIYWGIYDTSKIWPAVTSILIVACPCALLLAASFANGHTLRILSRHHLYLRNAQAIETLAATTHIVFDKTGTLTGKAQSATTWHGRALTVEEQLAIGAVSSQSQHPASRAITAVCSKPANAEVLRFAEDTGQGLQGWARQMHIQLGSAAYTGAKEGIGSQVHVNINGDYAGYFLLAHTYREGINEMLHALPYPLTLLSGDHDADAPLLRSMMGQKADLRFRQQPHQKLDHIIALQQQGKQVLMIGDGLNDAGALKQSNTGISLTENSNNFTPASDGIMEASQLRRLPAFIRFCQSGKRVILISFAVSVLYNITGLFFAVQGKLSPLTAAILMPASSISIVLLTWALSEWAGSRLLGDDSHHRP